MSSVYVQQVTRREKGKVDDGNKGESGLQLHTMTCLPKIAGFLPGLQEKFLFPWSGPRELQRKDDMKGKKQIFIRESV